MLKQYFLNLLELSAFFFNPFLHHFQLLALKGNQLQFQKHRLWNGEEMHRANSTTDFPVLEQAQLLASRPEREFLVTQSTLKIP